MIWLIAKKEFLNNIVTPGFIVGLLLCLILIPYTTFTGIRTYENRLAQYEADVKEAENIYQTSKTYSQVNPLLVKPVSALSIFSSGISEQTGSKVKLDRKEKPVFSSNIVLLNENPFLGDFMPLDFTTVLTILLSLLGVLFSYNMLSREKEDGTLKLALSNPVSRSVFFFGKITGIFLTLLPVLFISFLIIFIIIQFTPLVNFSADEYGRIGMLILLSLVYFAFFVFLGGFISSRTKSSVASIIVNLFIWCFLLFLLPNAATYLGKNITKADDYKQMRFNVNQIDWEFQKNRIPEIRKQLNDENLESIGWMVCQGSDYDGCNYLYFTPRASMAYERRLKELMNPILIENCGKKWLMQSVYLEKIYRQEKTIRFLSCLSPSGIFKQMSASLCHTGMNGEVQFMNQVRQFQDIFYGYFLQNGIFSSYAYFSPQKETDFPEDLEEAKEQYKKASKDFENLDTGDLPRFTYAPPTVGHDLSEQLYLIAGILAVCILLFFASFVSFIKYDPR
jgi:ABC-type transport system involved in multi-copper enzyme maturation permease subunit